MDFFCSIENNKNEDKGAPEKKIKLNVAELSADRDVVNKLWKLKPLSMLSYSTSLMEPGLKMKEMFSVKSNTSLQVSK